jgi:hypothetical protein
MDGKQYALQAETYILDALIERQNSMSMTPLSAAATGRRGTSFCRGRRSKRPIIGLW